MAAEIKTLWANQWRDGGAQFRSAGSRRWTSLHGTWGSSLLVLSGGYGPYIAGERPPALGNPAMFDALNYSDYDRWLTVFAEASARLDALETAVTDVRHLLHYSEDVNSKEIVKVLQKHGV